MEILLILLVLGYLYNACKDITKALTVKETLKTIAFVVFVIAYYKIIIA